MCSFERHNNENQCSGVQLANVFNPCKKGKAITQISDNPAGTMQKAAQGQYTTLLSSAQRGDETTSVVD
jgi:hypothetical protein